MVYAYLLVITAITFDIFYLTPGSDRIGGIRFSDLGLLLIVLGLIYYSFKGNIARHLGNFFSWYIIFYFLLVAVQVSVAGFKYSQSIIDGMIVARSQLYYLSFPLFLLALDDLGQIKTFLKVISVLAVVIIALSLFNYFVLTIFHHQRAEGHGTRAGMVRAFIPAMEILVVAAFWQFWSYLKDGRFMSPALAAFLMIYGGIIFRQTRGYIIAVTAVLVVMIVAEKRYLILVAATSVVAVLLIVNVLVSGEQSLLIIAFESAYSEMSEGQGTWGERMDQIRASWDVFMSSFATGSGGLVIRGTGAAGWAGWGELFHVAFNTDLGYWVWLKFFGYPGIMYLIILLIGFYSYVLRCGKLGESGFLGQFAAYHFLCILIAQVTLDYLTKPDGIFMLCLTWAILVKAVQSKELGNGIEQQKPDSERSAVDNSTDGRPGMEGQMI